MHALEPFRCFVDGDLVAGSRQGQVVNPATGEVFATFHVADERMLDLAVKSATRAFVRWRDTPLAERRALLVRLADIVQENAESLARLLTLEQGKPLTDSKAEIDRVAALYRHYAAIHGNDTEALFTTEDDIHVRSYTPLGVVAGIVPSNFPLFIAAMKIAPALLTGNVIIIKPAPTTPLTTLEFARLCAKAVPAGVVQVVGDDGSVGPMLTSHRGVCKVAFTGSTLTGRKIIMAASSTMKRLTLELGGNDPAVVLRDADPDFSAAGIFRAAFFNGGQMCGAAKRVYVHEDIYEPFCRALKDSVEAIVVGDGLQPGVTLGPLQNQAQYDKATALLADATRRGRVIAQKSCPAGKGYFIPPTVFGDLDDEHPLVTEEQFAPLLPILRFANEEDAIERANNTSYGLTASVWSANVPRAEAMVRRLEAALLCVNKHNKCSFQTGICMSKQSGAGWIFGDEGIKEYLQPHLLFR